MKYALRLIALTLMMTLLCPAALAAKTTPTPPPVEIVSSPVEPPASVQKALDIAYSEWETLAGKTLSRVNKYTEWRGEGIGFGWCGGYITWCMMEAGIGMEELEPIKDAAAKNKSGLYEVDGVYHIKEASVGKLLRGYQLMGRSTNIPQKGFLLVYGCSYNKTIHVGLVYDVIDLGGGKYRITTLEGNMSSRVKMYVRDYDMNAAVNTNSQKSTNLTEIPEDARILPESDHVDYSIVSAKPSNSADKKFRYYVNCFLMPWVPGDEVVTTPAPTVEHTLTPPPPAETLAPVETPAPETPAPTQEPAIPQATAAPEATAQPEATAEPTAAPEVTTFPCSGKDGDCPYITYSADDPFCRNCDFNDDGVED